MKAVKKLVPLIAASLLLLGTTSFAQSSSYTPGTVWNFSNIRIEPGQFENYMDFLASTWKKSNEFGMKEGNHSEGDEKPPGASHERLLPEIAAVSSYS